MALERQQRVRANAVLAQHVNAAQIRQVDDERRTRHETARAADELCRGLRGAARGDQIVDDQDALAWLYRIFVDLDDVDAILQCILLTDRLPGQLALLADWNEPAAQTVGDGAANDETARLN